MCSGSGSHAKYLVCVWNKGGEGIWRKIALGEKVGELCLTFLRSRPKAMCNKVGRILKTILQKHTFFSLLVFDKILINSCDSN